MAADNHPLEAIGNADGLYIENCSFEAISTIIAGATTASRLKANHLTTIFDQFRYRLQVIIASGASITLAALIAISFFGVTVTSIKTVKGKWRSE